MFRDWVYPAYVKAMRPRRDRKRQATDRSRLIEPGIVFCAVLGLNTDRTLVYQLFAFLLCMVLISRFCLRLRRPLVSVKRYLPKYATAGQPFEYQMAITNTGQNVEADLTVVDNPKIRPPDLEQFKNEKEPDEDTRNAYDRFIGFHRFIYLQKRNTGITIEPGKAPDIPLKATKTVHIEALPLRRGIIHFTSTTILHPDPLGLNLGVTNYENPGALLVLPKRYEIRKSFKLDGGRHFQPGGINASWSIGESDEFVSLRDYRDGDSVKKIHWASSAKRNKPVVREYQDEYFVRLALVLDTSNAKSDILEETISVAASFLLALDNADSMLDLIYLADKAEIFTSGRGTSQVNAQLEALATLGFSSLSVEKLSQAVASHVRLISGCILVLSNWSDEHQKMIQALRSANVSIEVFIITDNEKSLAHLPARYHLLPVDEIQNRLNQL